LRDLRDYGDYGDGCEDYYGHYGDEAEGAQKGITTGEEARRQRVHTTLHRIAQGDPCAKSGDLVPWKRWHIEVVQRYPHLNFRATEGTP
jgi:hypothetical protein